MSQTNLDEVIEKIMSGKKIRKLQEPNRKMELGGRAPRNRSNMAQVKRVHVKLRNDDSSSMSGSVKSRTSMKSKGLNQERDRKSDMSGYGSDKYS